MHRLNPISAIGQSFVHIAPSIHFRRAKVMAADSDSEATMNLQDPDLILLFTSTGAKPHHIAKYTSGYTKLFPSSPIMVITTSITDLLHRSSAQKQRSLIPAILTILSAQLESNIFVHCSSEVGAHRAVQFAKAFLKSTGRCLPISALCLDSARGTLHSTKTIADRYQKPTNGNGNGNGNAALQTLTSFLAYTLAPSSWTTYPMICDAFTTDDSKHLLFCDKTRRALNDPGLWDVGAPRCYLFSHTDKLTQPGSVSEHARGAEKYGARVFLTPFEDNAPCSRIETARYWAAVERTWDARSSNTNSSGPPSTATFTTDLQKNSAYDIYATALDKKPADLDIHVSVHELPSTRSPVDVAPTRL